MTRLAVLSDIHGNLPALEAVLTDLRQFTVDHVIVAGDTINWGPFNRDVLERVLNAGWAVIRGNNELYLLDYETPRAPKSWDAFTMPPWLHAQVNTYLPELSSWPDTLQLRFRDAPALRVYHGLPTTPFKGIHPLMSEESITEILAPIEENTYLSGHTHLMLDKFIGRHHVLNPSTVGCPLDGFEGATYLLLEGDWDGWQATFRRVPCDFSPCIREFERQGFVEQVGPMGRLVMEEFVVSRLRLWPFKAWLAEQFPNQFIRDHDLDPALVDRFLTFSEDEMEKYMPSEYTRANLRRL